MSRILAGRLAALVSFLSELVTYPSLSPRTPLASALGATTLPVLESTYCSVTGLPVRELMWSSWIRRPETTAGNRRTGHDTSDKRRNPFHTASAIGNLR